MTYGLDEAIEDSIDEDLELLAKDIYEFGQNRWDQGEWAFVTGKERKSVINFAKRILAHAKQIEQRKLVGVLDDFITQHLRWAHE